ncbi:hypothetical protein HO133_002419 [Letharia lupina]|uniref:Uncharacterized protein n=1 Tax=Letharia lupina TaxID=560253 RepID=A0A8H6CDJ3_9LECA|nr:uncharacterized protein HO133_002419 [Letharia lupina]KAF6221563.1 hypothetical protein HO133_002419 [Letharia lupina]
MTDNGTFPDGNKSLTLIGGFAIGLALAENVKSGAESAEDLETIVRRFGSDNLPRYIGEKVGLVQVLVSDYMCSAKVAEAEEVTMIMFVRTILDALYLDTGMSGVKSSLGKCDGVLGKRSKSEPGADAAMGYLDVFDEPYGEDEGEGKRTRADIVEICGAV